MGGLRAMPDLDVDSVFPLNSVPATGHTHRSIAALLAVVLASVLALLFLAWPGSASASPAYPPAYPPSTSGCTVSTTTVNAGPGDSLHLVGSGFKPNTTVTLSIPAASAALGSVKTRADGTFSKSFTWPASVNGKSAAVVAMAGSTTCKFTLTNGTDSVSSHRASGSGSGGGGLSSTGFATLTATTIAIVLIGAGAIFLGLARRRRA
jgi:hypothetical protein